MCSNLCNVVFSLVTRILPVLEAETVARETVTAILIEEPMCLVPSRLSILLALKS